MRRPRVLVLRGQNANPWDLRPWEELDGRFEVEVAVPGDNAYDTSLLRLERIPVRTLSGLVPGRRLAGLAARAPFNRYLGLGEKLAAADIVHAAELHPWYSAQAARAKSRFGYRLVITAWETIPFLETYRRLLSRPARRVIAARADLFQATTERARHALLLEGVAPERIEVSPPGIDLERFRVAPVSPAKEAGHLIVSPGRLVWEKGHQDVLRALAAIRRETVEGGGTTTPAPRLLIVGAGPEEARLRAYAGELGLSESVEWRRAVPYNEMPAVYARATAMVLASLPTPSWEEQFGMVLAEAMAAGLPIVASSSGAIPEVVGDSATLFAPGDWLGLAAALVNGPLSASPGTRVDHPPERLETFSARAAGERLAAAYDRVLSVPARAA